MWLCLIAACVIIGCLPERNDFQSPSFYFDPPTAIQGGTIVAQIRADAVNWDDCLGADNSVVFMDSVDEGEGASRGIRAYDLERDEFGNAHVFLSVGKDVVPQIYYATLRCGKRNLKGALEIRPRGTDTKLIIEPSSLRRGDVSDVVIQAGGIVFSDDHTLVQFAKGAPLVLLHARVDDLEPWKLNARIHVLDIATPGDVSVSVLTGGVASHGVLGITNRKDPVVSVTPDALVRPFNSRNNRYHYNIDIETTNLRLDDEGQDGGVADAAPGIEVDFPRNMGIKVEGIQVLGPNQMTAALSVSHAARIGAGPLRVRVLDDVAQTAFNIKSLAGVPAIELSPHRIARGQYRHPVYIRSHNFDLGSATAVSLVKPNCLVPDCPEADCSDAHCLDADCLHPDYSLIHEWDKHSAPDGATVDTLPVLVTIAPKTEERLASVCVQSGTRRFEALIEITEPSEPFFDPTYKKNHHRLLPREKERSLVRFPL